MRCLVSCCLFFLVTGILNAQLVEFDWVNHLGGTGHARGYSLALDDNGNSFVTGYYTNHFTYGLHQDSVVNSIGPGNKDAFVQKIDSNGVPVWTKFWGSTDFDEGISVAVDEFGSVYVIGMFRGTVDFDPGIGVTSLTALGKDDVFVLKLSSKGSFEWVKRIGGESYDNAKMIAVSLSS